MLGHKWNLLLLREAFLGRTKYGEFQKIGVPSGTLGSRLDELVNGGLLERQTYRTEGERPRDEYVLTQTGRDVLPVLVALGEWADEHMPLPNGPSVVVLTAAQRRPARLEFVDEAGSVVPGKAVSFARGPGFVAS